MTAESSPRRKSQDSFGETAAPACDVARAGTARTRWAVALLVVGLVVAFVPGLAAGNGFLGVIHVWFVPGSDRGEWIELAGRWYSPSRLPGDEVFGTSALDLVHSAIEWAIVAASLGVVPVLFGLWRRADIGFARTAGPVLAVAASVSVIALVGSMRGMSDLPAGVWWTVPAGGALMAAAFCIAPAPRVRDDG